MIRVLHVTNAFPSANAPAYGVFIREQIESLDTNAVASSVMVVAQGGGVTGYLRHLRRLRKAAAQADLVHCHHMLCGVLGLFAGLRSKMIVSFTSDGALNYKARPAWLGRSLFALVSRLSVHNIYKSRVPAPYAAKSTLLPNGVDEAVFCPGDKYEARRKLGLPCEGRLVLFVSAISLDRPEKRFDFFKAVLSELERRSPGHFGGVSICDVSRDRVPLYYRAVDVHLLTSDVEGSPNSVKEALASGVPCVSRDVGNVASMLAAVPGCAIFEGDDAAGVARLVEFALRADSSAVREAFLAKGLGLRQVADRLQGIYRTVHERRQV